MNQTSAVVEFCGERHEVEPDRAFTIGREADLVVDTNRFLHRRLLELARADRLWWLANVGSALSVTVVDGEGSVHAWLAPGGRLPLVFPRTTVWFTAGPTTYELEIVVADAPFDAVKPTAEQDVAGPTTSIPAALTPEQLRVVAALCDPLLRVRTTGASQIPTSAEAAARLGWTLTKFNRKLDTVCEKLAGQGVRGLHGSDGRLAVNRRARLVEYALSTRLVDGHELDMVDRTPPG